MIGLLSYTINSEKVYIEDFVISCRAAGRMVEEVMIYFVRNIASESRGLEIILQAIATEKNGPLVSCLRGSRSFTEVEPLKFKVKAGAEIVCPPNINLSCEQAPQ